MKLNDQKIANTRYGKLTPIKISKRNSYGAKYWLCKCDCGAEKEIRQVSFTSGQTISCGCYGKQKSLERIKSNILPNSEAAFNSLYTNLKNRAEKKELEFSITKDELKRLSKLPCYYCNKVEQNEYKTYHSTNSYFYNGLDRINNSKGYTINNVLTCCGICNKIRGNWLTIEETKIAVTAIMEYRKVLK